MNNIHVIVSSSANAKHIDYLRPNHYHKFDWKAWKELVSQDQIIDRKQNLRDWL